MGRVANPGSAFSAKLGNRLHDGLFITDNGTSADQFSLSELTFNMNRSDSADALTYQCSVTNTYSLVAASGATIASITSVANPG